MVDSKRRSDKMANGVNLMSKLIKNEQVLLKKKDQLYVISSAQTSNLSL